MRNSCLEVEKEWSTQEWVDKKFVEDLIEVLKIQNDKNNNYRKPWGMRRVTKALRDLSYWKNILKDLAEGIWKEDRWKNEN